MSDRLRIILSLLLGLVAIALYVLGYLTQPVQAIIEWSTESEVGTVGFDIYRATSADGDYQKINETLIPSSGDQFTGASYSYEDSTIEPGVTYYYQLEELEDTGNLTRMPDTVTFDSPAGINRTLSQINWTTVSVLLVLLAAIWLLFTPKRSRPQPDNATADRVQI
ncbi:MAG: hypothetical protein KDD73_00380 [Anaerolineales bacterium]|nr:hypothetical protein [Anaerolineales bacterium]MCB9127914.1 hypothetical protein [Ardenticatenales bacterium]MCB9171676.1 hypothetical protein [Ardenticatenales bacterium]